MGTLIDLPARSDARQQARGWLKAERISHFVLFQQVKVHDPNEGRRFKTWIAAHLA